MDKIQNNITFFKDVTRAIKHVMHFILMQNMESKKYAG